jgi:hypothetical protein
LLGLHTQEVRQLFPGDPRAQGLPRIDLLVDLTESFLNVKIVQPFLSSLRNSLEVLICSSVGTHGSRSLER